MKSTREVTIYDIAKVLNISPSTVSRGLKEHPSLKKDTVSKIKDTAHKMGYQRNKFASNLRQKHTNTIGVVVPKLNSYFMATVISGIENITTRNGYGLIISQSQESVSHEIACVSTLFNSRVDGLLVSLAFDTKNMDHINLLLNKSIPVVFFDRVSDCNGCMSVVIDNYKAGYEVTTHLIDQGCRRIVHIGGNLLRNVYNDRFMGYKKALADHNIQFDQDLVFLTDLSGQSGTEVAGKIVKMKVRPDALFSSNDTSAVAVIVELLRSGLRIPQDVAVAGFNNEPISQIIQPNLTSVEYPAREIGEISANLLISKLNGDLSDNLSTIVVKHQLVIRDSSLKRSNRKSESEQ